MLSNLIAFIVLFGILVFVHELGHFLTAKYFKIGVEKFSLGYGPKLFSKTYGGTEYLISALPLGGYVKMVGDEPIDEKAAEEAGGELPENSFLAKPPWQRILVVLMGPIANLVLPVVLLTGLYMVGQPKLSTTVGFVGPDSPAMNAGIKPGDKITEIDGEPVGDWVSLAKTIEKNPEKELVLTLLRGGDQETLAITPEVGDTYSPFGEKIPGGVIGIRPQFFAPDMVIPNEQSPAYAVGLRSGDRLIKVAGKEASFFWQLHDALLASTGSVPIVVQRADEEKSFTLNRADFAINQSISLTQGGIHHKQMQIDKIMPGSIAEEKGLKSGDVLVAINGENIPNWMVFQERILANRGESVALTVFRDGGALDLDLSPKLVEQTDELTGETDKQRMLGVTTAGELLTDTVVQRVSNPFLAFKLSVERCYKFVYLTVVGFYKLFAGDLSTKSLGGPIMIYQLAGKSWQSGFHDFINILVLISITLAILNLLPIPILDGGHLVFYTIEMIQGRPISARIREVAQMVGVWLILGLMVFAFYNDLNRVGLFKWIKGLFS